MGVQLHTAPATESLPARVLALVGGSDTGAERVYEFTIEGDRRVVLEQVHHTGEEEPTAEIPDAVMEALTAAGYTVVNQDAVTDGGRDQLDALVEALESARDADLGDRQSLKLALGEAAQLHADGVAVAEEVQEQLRSALAAPPEHEPYFIDQALQLVGEGQHNPSAEPGAVTETSEPPACVQWLDEDHGVLEIGVTRPFIEWMELEVADTSFDTVEEWVQARLWLCLTNDLQDRHGFAVDVDVDLPEDYAKRVALWWADRKVRGEADDADLDAFLFNHMHFRPRWMLDGDSWGVAEDAGLQPASGGEGDDGN